MSNGRANVERRLALGLASLVGLMLVLHASPGYTQGPLDDDLFAEEELGSDEDLFAEEEDLFGDEPEEEDLFRQPDEAGEAAADTEALTREDGLAPAEIPPAEAPGEDAEVPEIALEKDEIEAVGPSSDVEEILIQGQAATGIEIDTTASTTVFDAGDLQAMGVEDVSDVAQYTPNLEIRKTSSTTATFFIRGVGLNDFTANSSGAVAIYMDDVAMNLPPFQLGQLFDVSDLVVEKGPLGTGPGRNATAGAIRIASRKPQGETSGFWRADVGNFQYFDTEGALELPLFRDVLSARSAFRFTERDGIIDNRCGGFSPAEVAATNGRNLCSNFQAIRPNLEEELNDIYEWAVRTTFRYVPPDTDWDWLLSIHGGKIDQLGTVGQHLGTQQQALGTSDNLGYVAPEISKELDNIRSKLPPPPPISQCNRLPRGSPERAECFERRNDFQRRSFGILARHLSNRPLDRKPFEGDYNEPGYERMDTYGGFLRGERELDWVSFTGIGAFEHYDRQRFVDADYSPNRIFEFDIEDVAWQASLDLRAEGVLDALPLEWEAGAYYLQEELDYDQLTLPGGDIRRLEQKFVQETYSLGIYGELSWEILDDFFLEGGARWNWEKKTFDIEIDRAMSDRCQPTGSGRVPACDEVRTFSAPTGTVGFRWHVDDEKSIYWKYTRGWKGAQFNIRDGNPPLDVIDVATPETIDAFEIGTSNSLLDGMLTIDGALFWYQYQDYQVFQFTNDVESPPQRVVINANDAQLYGAELDIVAEPSDLLEGLKATLRFGWLESKFLNFSQTGTRRQASNIPGEAFFFEQVIDYNGNRLPNTPRFKVSGTLEYELDLGRYGSITSRYDVTWTDDVFFDSSQGIGAPSLTGQQVLPKYAIGQKAYWTHDFRMTFRTAEGNLELTGWVRNLSNEVYKSLAFDASSAVNLVGNLVGDPRTFGGSMTVKF